MRRAFRCAIIFLALGWPAAALADPDPDLVVPADPVTPVVPDIRPPDYAALLRIEGTPFYQIHRFDLNGLIRAKQALGEKTANVIELKQALGQCEEYRVEDALRLQQGRTGWDGIPWWGHSLIYVAVAITGKLAIDYGPKLVEAAF